MVTMATITTKSTTIKQKKTSSGGASFSPRLDPRPQYPPVSTFLYRLAMNFTRAPLLMALTAKALFPLYVRVVQALRAKGWSERGIFVLFVSGVHASLYWSMNGFFGFCDYTGALSQHKLYASKAQRPSAQLMASTLRDAFLGQFVLGPVMLWQGYGIFKRFGMPDLTAALPGLWTLYKQFLLCQVWNDVGFYWVHRLLHSKALYARIHKKHHQYIETVGIAAEHSSIPEQLAANYPPTLGGAVLFGRHPMVLFTWLATRLIETYEGHSGYYFGNTFAAKIGLTFSEHSAFHSSHHLSNRGAFGAYWLDWLFGTMDAFAADGDVDGYVKTQLRPRED